MNGKKKLIVLLAAIVVAVAAVVGVVVSVVSCKDKNNSESVDNGIAKNAEYYCVAEDEEYVVTLTNEKAYYLSVAGERKTGDYTLSEGGELKLIVDGKELSARISGDELALTYGGKSYTLIEKINRNVTFNDDGATTTATVLNGKSVAKPADPEEKEGKKFVGWYTSAEYKEVYNFATPVRTDITVYAQHVELTAGAKEFTVTLKDGSDEKIRTTNGVVYGLESLADKDGKEFDGWYVSDFNDEAKLTYKYNGEALKQNVNLYPVWKDEINAVSVTEGKISWESDGTSFDVKITDADNVSETKRSTQKYLDYDFKNVGEYKVEIGKTGSDKVTVVYYNSKALARVSNITVVEGGVVSYNAVENAEKYLVTVECGNASHKHTNVDNGKRTYFDISGCDMKEGGIKVTVVAQAKGYGSSQSEAFYYDRTLDKIAAVEVKDGKLVWSGVENALGYVVVVNGDKFEVGKVTEYSLKGYAAGDYELEVYPVTKGYNSPAAATVTYKKDKLATPAGVAVNGNVLKWESVAGATSYTVKLNGKTFTSDKNEAELNAEDIKTDNTVTVTAIGDGVQSEESDVFAFAYNEITNVEYANGKLTWKGIYIAEKYVISLNGNELGKVDADKTSYAINFKLPGENTIEVGYTANGNEIILGKVSVTVMVYTVSFSGDGGVDLGSLLAVVGDDLVAPEATKAGYNFDGWYKVPDGGKNNAKKFTGGKLETAGDIRFYADFAAAKYDVILNADAEESEQITAQVTYKEEFFLEPIESKDTTKTFGGWYTDENGRGTQITDRLGNGLGVWTLVGNNVKLYANWLSLFNFELNSQAKGYIVTGAEGLQYVTSAKIPETYVEGTNAASVVTVDDLNFGDKLVSIEIPDTVTTIETGARVGVESSAFKNCKALKSITIYKTGKVENPKYTSHDGILYEAVENNAGEFSLLLAPYAKDGSVQIFDGTTLVSDYALANSDIEKIVIPETVTKVGNNAFANMRKLTEVEFLGSDASLEVTLGEQVFSGNSKLTKVTLPAGLKASTSHIVEYSNDREEQDKNGDSYEVAHEFDMEFDVMLFTKSFTLEEVNVNGDGGYYKSIDGMLCKADGTIVYCPRGREKDVVTTGVTAIGKNAFRNCNKIKSVTITGTVKNIGFDAFVCDTGHPSALTQLVFDSNRDDEELTIEGRAFYKAVVLTEVTLPENLIKIEKYAFGFTKALKSVTINAMGKYSNDKYVAEFDNDVFASETDYVPDYYVENLTIGKDVPIFGITAVFGTSLSNITIDPANKNFDLTDKKVILSADGTELLYAFANAISGTYTVKEGVKVIEANSFANATRMTSIVIPASVEAIGDGAFRNCGLNSVVFASGKDNAATKLDIGAQAFYGCPIKGIFTLPERLTKVGDEAFKNVNATEIKFTGNKLTAIGNRAFENCDYLETITLSDGVTSIGDEAFWFCEKLQTINLPNTIETLGDDMLNKCYSLQAINVAEGCAKYSTFGGILYENKDGAPSVLVLCPTLNSGDEENKVIIPNTVIEVKDSAFVDNNGIVTIEFTDYDPDFMAKNELRLGEGLFIGAKTLETVKLPKGLKQIPSGAFTGIGTVYYKNVIVPNTVTMINQDAFGYSLESVTFEEGNTDAPLTIADAKSSSKGVFAKATKLQQVIFPERTKVIGKYAFATSGGLRQLSYVYIPSTVTTIGQYAFQGQSKLLNVVFGEGIKLATIDNYVFQNCTLLGSNDDFKVPSSVTSIGNFAFSGTGIKSLTLSSNVSSIGTNAFEKCLNLATVTINSSKLSIGKAAFNGCVKLSDVSLPEGLSTIGNNAFAGTAIRNITIPSSVVTIGEQAFKDSSLGGNDGKIIFALNGDGKSAISKIGDEAFAGTKLTEFDLPETTDSLTLGAKIFKGCLALTTVHISSTVTDIGTAFDGGIEITDVKVDGDKFMVTGGMLTNVKSDGSYDTIYYVFGQLDLKDGVLTIPEGVTSIGDRAFLGYTDIKKLVLPSTLIKLGDNAFQNCTGIEIIEFRNGSPSLTSISKYAFAGCKSLKEVNLPETITTVSDYAFDDCVSLANLSMPGVVKIGIYSFRNTAIENLVMGSNVTTIEKNAFENSKIKSVSFNAKLKTIGNYAFQNTLLTAVNITAGITSIGSYAFCNNNNLASVTFADNGSLTSIGSSAFKATAISGVEIPATVTTLGSSVFENCSNLTDVVFKGNAINTIDTAAFANTAIQSIVIPDSVTTIKSGAFQDCTALTEVKLSSNLKTLATISSSKTTANKGSVFEGCTSLEYIDLPDSLTYMGTFTFRNSGLKKITIPANVKFLTVKEALPSAMSGSTGTYFQDGSKDLPAMSENYFAGQFANCLELEEVILPTNLQAIGAGVFYNTPKLKTLKYTGYTGEENILPATVTELGGYAFLNCGLESLTAGGLKSIYKNAFSESNLRAVDLSDSPLSTIDIFAFRNTEKLRKVQLPSKLTKIGRAAFENSGIQELLLPETVTTIESAAFRNSSLTSINLSNVISYGAERWRASSTYGYIEDGYIFENCKYLASVVLSKDLSMLVDGMFRNCNSLETFVIPENIISIGDECFVGTNISNLRIPSNVEAIGSAALGTASLKTLTLSEDNRSYKIENGFLLNSDSKLIAYFGDGEEVTIPDSVTDIEKGVFAGNSYLKRIIVPASITTIKTNMFYNCGAEEIILNEGITTIKEMAFNGCKNLLRLALPASIQTVEWDAFKGLGDLSNLNLVLDLSKLRFDACEQRILGDCVAKEVILPDDWTELPKQMFWGARVVNIQLPGALETIGASMFKGSSWDSLLEEIEIPANVTTIGSSAFEDCVKLKSVKFLGNKITVIPSSAFKSCHSLTDIVLPDGITEIGASAFTGKYIAPSTKPYMGAAFTSITIPASVTTISANAFQYCRNLETIIFKGTITDIGASAFAECVSLKNIDLSNVTNYGASVFTGAGLENVTLRGDATYGKTVFQYCTDLKTVTFTDGSATLGASMFSGCTSLTKVTLPDKITAIPSSLFASCSALTEVNIPETITTIGSSAFSGCSSLKSVNLGDKVTTIEAYAFQNCTSIQSINIPMNVYDIATNGIFSGWTAEQTINFGYEGYQAFRLYGEKLLNGCAAKVNFGVAK